MAPTDPKCCQINISIHSQGDVTIYNCSAPGGVTQAEEGVQPMPVSPGACVPLALGAKPKQSQQRKLEKLLARNPVPSALAASCIQLLRRYMVDRTPANTLEQRAFDRLRQLKPGYKQTLSCVLDQFDQIQTADRNRLFDMSLVGDLDTAVDSDKLLQAFNSEVAQRISLVAFEDATCVTEQPGKIRVFDPGSGEHFITQVRICRINGLRTSQYQPALGISSYLPTELQQECMPTVVNGEVQVNCSPQNGNCPGHMWSDGTCFRVPEIDAGQAVQLEGVNFFSVDTTIRLRLKGSSDTPLTIEAHVCGDQDTPVNELINGNTVLIADCRVRDRLTFQIPPNLPAGVYEFYVEVPNITGIANLGSVLASLPEYICVMPSPTARFRIDGEKLHAHRETAPASFGSDEVAIRFLTVGIKADGTFCELEHVEATFADVDSGETRNLTCVPLPEYAQPLLAVSILVLGYEVDNYATYLEQVNSVSEVFLDLVKMLWMLIAAAVGYYSILALVLGNGWVLLGAAVVAAILLGASLILALWAPADLIMQDVISWSACDLAALTSDAYPAPAPMQYQTADDIEVKVDSVQKGGSEYLERREYTCDDEDSRYAITLRYSRVA